MNGEINCDDKREPIKIQQKEIKMSFKKMFENARKSPKYQEFGMFLELCEVLIAEMEKQKISRAELSRKMGVSRSYISNFFKGANVTIGTIAKFAIALGCEIKINPVLEKMDFKKD